MKTQISILALVFVLFLAKNSTAQTSDNINISILSPAITYEKGLNDKQTLFFSGQLETSTYKDFYDETVLNLHPAILADWRNYYNFDKRNRKGKKTSENSGNFIALRFAGIGSPIKTIGGSPYITPKPTIGLGGVWGIQRIYDSGVYLNLSLGLGAYTSSGGVFSFGGIGNFHLGFNISSKNKTK